MEKGVRSLSDEINIRRSHGIPFSQEQLFEIFVGITEGVLFLHQKCKIFHKGLKSSNIVYFKANNAEIIKKS